MLPFWPHIACALCARCMYSESYLTSLTKWLRAINILILHPSLPHPVLLWRASWRRGRVRRRNQNLNRGGKGENVLIDSKMDRLGTWKATTGLLAHCCLQKVFIFRFRSIIRSWTVINCEASKGGGAHNQIDLAAKIPREHICSISHPTLIMSCILSMVIAWESAFASSFPSSLSLTFQWAPW